MIADVRQQLKGPLAQFIVFAFLAGTIMGVVIPLITRQGSTPWALRINGDAIEIPEYFHTVELQRAQLQAYAQFAEAIWGTNDIRALAQQFGTYQLIGSRLQQQLVHNVGIKVDCDTVFDYLQKPSFLSERLGRILPPFVFDPAGGFNRQLLTAYLQRAKLSSQFVDEQIEAAVAGQQLDQIIDASVYVPTWMIKQEYIKKNAIRSYTIYEIPFTPFREQQVATSISDDSLRAFYDARRQEYIVPEKRSGVAYTVDMKKASIAIPESDIKNYYEQYKVEKYQQTPAKVQIRELMLSLPDDIKEREVVLAKAAALREQAITAPQTFGDLIKQHSQDTERAAQGGVRPAFARADTTVLPEVSRAAFLLKENNEFSPLITTKDAVYIIQRINREPAIFKSLDAVREEIASTLKVDAFKKQLAKELQDINKVAVPDRMQAIATFSNTYNATIQQLKDVDDTTELDSTIKGLLFASKNIGSLHHTFTDGMAIVVHLNQVTPAIQPEFSTIKDRVMNDYRQDQAYAQLKQVAKQLVNALLAVKTATKNTESTSDEAQNVLNKLIQEYAIKTRSVQNLDPKKPENYKALKEEGLPIEGMLSLTGEGTSITEIGDTRGIVANLTNIASISDKDIQKQRGALTTQLRRMYEGLTKQGLVASQLRNATIEFNKEIINAA